MLGPPVAGSVAEKAGMRAGDWVRAWSLDGDEWHDVRSIDDLRWQLTRRCCRRGPRPARQRPRRQRPAARAPALSTLVGAEVDAKPMQRIGIGNPWSEPVLGEVKAGGAGARGGPAGGRPRLAIDGMRSATLAGARPDPRERQERRATPMQWRIERARHALDLVVTPRSRIDTASRVGRIEPTSGQPPEMVSVRYGPSKACEAVTQTWQMSALTVKMLGKMVIGQASLKNLSGPLTIADYAGKSASLGLAHYLGFLAVVRVSLGVLNLLPLPVLDGGHLMNYFFGRPSRAGERLPTPWMERLQRGGVAVLLVMMSIALFNDVARLLGLQ